MTMDQNQETNAPKTPVHLHPDDINTLIGALIKDISSGTGYVGDSLFWSISKQGMPDSTKKNANKQIISLASADLLQELAPHHKRYMTENSNLQKLDAFPYNKSGSPQLTDMLNDIAKNGVVADKNVTGKKFGFYGAQPNGDSDLVAGLQVTAQNFKDKLNGNILAHNQRLESKRREFATNKDTSSAVRLTDADIRLLLGAIVNDTVKHDEAVNSYDFRFQTLQYHSATGPAVKRSDKNSIVSYSNADILSNAVRASHGYYTAKGSATAKLGLHPFNANVDIHNTLDQIMQHGVVQDDSIDRVFPHHHVVENANAPGGKLGVIYGGNLEFESRMHREAEYLLSSLPEFVKNYNSVFSPIRENKFDDVDAENLRNHINLTDNKKKTSFVPFI